MGTFVDSAAAVVSYQKEDVIHIISSNFIMNYVNYISIMKFINKKGKVVPVLN
jgi:hypothetical protein